MPAEGEFSFTAEDGEQYDGEFIAEWVDQAVYRESHPHNIYIISSSYPEVFTVL